MKNCFSHPSLAFPSPCFELPRAAELSRRHRMAQGLYLAGAQEAIRAKPALTIWGDADRTLQAKHFLPIFSALFPAAPIHRLPGVGHYCFEDAPEQISQLIAAFLQQTRTATA